MADFLRGDDKEVASFFAFQDVIVAVLGILILIALQLSFSINILKGGGGIEESQLDYHIITEQEFIEKREERKLEIKLSHLRDQNREILSNKNVLESAGEPIQGIEDSIRLLVFEIKQLELDLESLDQTLNDKGKLLVKRLQI